MALQDNGSAMLEGGMVGGLCVVTVAVTVAVAVAIVDVAEGGCSVCVSKIDAQDGNSRNRACLPLEGLVL